jgi:hypothetical protein
MLYLTLSCTNTMISSKIPYSAVFSNKIKHNSIFLASEINAILRQIHLAFFI